MKNICLALILPTQDYLYTNMSVVTERMEKFLRKYKDPNQPIENMTLDPETAEEKAERERQERINELSQKVQALRAFVTSVPHPAHIDPIDLEFVTPTPRSAHTRQVKDAIFSQPSTL